MQKLLGNEEFIGASLGDSDATLEKKYVKLVLDLADEMGLKRDYLEDALLEPVRKQAVLEQIHEVGLNHELLTDADAFFLIEYYLVLYLMTSMQS